jgi:hypothetical protein
MNIEITITEKRKIRQGNLEYEGGILSVKRRLRQKSPYPLHTPDNIKAALISASLEFSLLNGFFQRVSGELVIPVIVKRFFGAYDGLYDGFKSVLTILAYVTGPNMPVTATGNWFTKCMSAYITIQRFHKRLLVY